LRLEKYAILSLAGEHAKESFDEIIQRKKKDIENIGYTFWLENSYKTYPDKVQKFYGIANKERIELDCLLYMGNTQDTKHNTKAKEYSVDKRNWQKIDSKLSPITGKMSENTHALVFDKLDSKTMDLNLENYVEFDSNSPIRNYPNVSTFCSIKKHDNIVAKKPNNIRKIFAIGRIHKPSSVWLR